MITLSDLKSCKLTPFFYNTFINVEKYLEYEQRDPVTTSKVWGNDSMEIWKHGVLKYEHENKGYGSMGIGV